MNYPSSTLIVEDNPIIALGFENLLVSFGIENINVATSFEEAISHHDIFELALIDINLGGGNDGFELAKQIQKKGPNTKIIFITAYKDQKIMSRVSEIKNAVLLEKPLHENELKVALETNP
ncbi:MAG: response regulator [Bacteriovoracaceae bacterium]|jgi:DNA-binding NarL/FixJ family response regulator|nr:response regulator [Bacteriovoracaceae bacterium]